MKTYRILATLALTATLSSCGDMLENIRPYIDEGETIYVGKLEHFFAFPGNNRIGLIGLLPYGMTQTKCVISWTHPSGEPGSKTIDIVRTSPDDYINIMLDNMEEGPYDFTAVTYDHEGHSSIPVKTNGYVYGNMYRSSLANRNISGNIVTSYENGEMLSTITWLPISYEEAVDTRLTYRLAAGGTQSMVVKKDEMSTVIRGAQPGGDFTWYTTYLPDSLAIDTFDSPTTTAQSTTSFKIPVKNAGNPFVNDSRGLAIHGRFGYVKDWTANAAAEANGTFDTYGGRNSLSLWAWPGYSPVGDVVDAKVYQTITLPAGNYRFDVHLNSASQDGSTYNVYAAVATGFADGLPDTENISQALGSARVPNDVVNNALSVEFTLTQSAEIAFGIVADISGGQDINVAYVELWGI